jgi:hypothetical protein
MAENILVTKPSWATIISGVCWFAAKKRILAIIKNKKLDESVG